MNLRKSQTIRLCVMLSLTFGFFIVELVVGYVTDSLALISDSYHMLSDTLALVIGLTCVRISHWNSSNNTYGWVRAEIVGALVNSVFLVALCFTILTDGITRLVEPERIHNVDLLLYVGIAGLGINVFGLFMFCSDTQGGHHGHSHGGGGGGGGHGGGRKGRHDEGGRKGLHDEAGHGHSHGHDDDEATGAAGKKHRGHSHETGDGHGHSHAAGHGGGGHSHGSDSNHGYDRTKVDSVNGVHHESRAIEWSGSRGSNGVCVEDSPYEHPVQHITLTIDSDCEVVEDDTTLEESPQDDDVISYNKKAPLMKSGSQMNMLGVFLHVLGDALGSVVVIVSALVIKFVPYDWTLRLDPAMSIIMAIIILSTTIPLLKESAMVLMQTVPTHIKVSELQEKLLNKVNGITGLHEFHIWQLTGKRIVASGHIRVDNLTDYAKVAHKVKSFFHDEGIHSTTFQPEFTENRIERASEEQTKRDCVLECGPDKTCFENTCCSNKLKKKKNANGLASSNDVELGPQETNQSFEMTDETTTSTKTEAPSTERIAIQTKEAEMTQQSTHI